ncbi:MAG: DUF2231 domain-containing protein [Actinomycetota bacterium]|nr:DUF2231 domain-containing protein [Actinomycetota bacterium]
MARLFSIKPTLTMKGRQFNGLRGWSGKPLHPPLTDIPVAAYVLVAMFDLISFIAGRGEGESRLAHDLFRAGTFTIIAGAIVSVPTALTGFWDWLKSTAAHTQAWRTANWHMAVMLTVTTIVLVNIIARLAADSNATPAGVMLMSLVIGGLVLLGAAYGGALVYDYGFNVETSGDHPAWHESEEDVYPGDE